MNNDSFTFFLALTVLMGESSVLLAVSSTAHFGVAALGMAKCEDAIKEPSEINVNVTNASHFNECKRAAA